MDSHKTLFIPGPTEVPEFIREALSRPVVGHRSEEYEEIHERVIKRLKKLLHTDQHVFLATCSGTGMLEAGSRNLLREDDTVLNCICGSWSERWQLITERCGKTTDSVTVDEGQPLLPELIDEKLQSGSYDAVTVIHNETATGVMNPIKEIGEMLENHPDVLYMVDAVSSMAGTEIKVDDWGLDFVVSSVQKCFAVPPGLTVFAMSDQAFQRGLDVENPGYYFDLENFKSYNDKNQLISTGSLPQVFGLDVQLDNIINDEGPQNRYQRHEEMAERTREWALEQGFGLFAEEGYESSTITCVDNTLGISIDRLNEHLAERGFVISNGYGDLAEETFRIGHMGEHRMDDLNELLDHMEDIIQNEL